MAQAIMDPEKVRRFADELQRFNSDLENRMSLLHARFAALGDTASMKLYAKDALEAGATALDFRELLYLTAVYAGVPKAIEATRIFTQIVAEREVQSADRATPRDY